jgi:hypothetical protein
MNVLKQKLEPVMEADNQSPSSVHTCSETEIPAVEEKERVGSLPHKNPKQDRLIEASALCLKYSFISDQMLNI